MAGSSRHVIWACLLVASGAAGVPLCSAEPGDASSASEDAFFDAVERRAFDYFRNESNPENGLVRNTTEPGAPASPSAAGFALSAIPVAVERGWISRREGCRRAQRILTTYWEDVEHHHGFFYHYTHIATGRRMWSSEASVLDTAIFLAGALTAGEYFAGTDVQETARAIYERVDWTAMLTPDGRHVRMAWTPEAGAQTPMTGFSEGILALLLGLGSPTHPLPESVWHALERPVGDYGGHQVVHSYEGSLFVYQLPLAWMDLRGLTDDYADYWENATHAILANRAFCLEHQGQFRTYGPEAWGLSASIGPGGYRAYGAQPGLNQHDGTVAPYAVAASIPFVPELAVPAYRAMHQQHRALLWGPYGLRDAFNLDGNWASPHYVANDQGLTLVMIENHRTGLVWRLFSQHPVMRRALLRAAFRAHRATFTSVTTHP